MQILVDHECYVVNINNLSIIDSLVVLSIEGQIDSIRREDQDSLAIDVSQLDVEKGNYLKILVGNLAADKSFTVFRNYKASSSFQGIVIEINNFTSDIEYSKPFEKSFLGKYYVARSVDFKLQGQCYSARTEEVKFAIDRKITYTDDLPYEIISEIENPNYKFTIGKREDYTFWEKIYEPALVFTSVAIVVYLFFTQRS